MELQLQMDLVQAAVTLQSSLRLCNPLRSWRKNHRSAENNSLMRSLVTVPPEADPGQRPCRVQVRRLCNGLTCRPGSHGEVPDLRNQGAPNNPGLFFLRFSDLHPRGSSCPHRLLTGLKLLVLIQLNHLNWS